jgi:hypothetical protein
MRTTLDIEEDVLLAAKREGSTAGHIISLLARRGLSNPMSKHTKTPVIREGSHLYDREGKL